MKVSREQAAQNRERVVETAARLFREHGYDGIGVADLMKGAGLTHGGFYGQFASKEELLAEACERALQVSVQRWQDAARQAAEQALETIAHSYLSEYHLQHPGTGCAVTSLGADVARLGAKARAALTGGARGQLAVLEQLVPGASAQEKRRRALAVYAGMVGAVVLARAVDDEALAQEILQAQLAQLLDMQKTNI
ncbi:TetR/AcrR family transcriptional regulator [Oxalobacteraceae bacterium A2-2]